MTKAIWVDSELFLLISAEENGSFKDYAVYGYGFATDSRLNALHYINGQYEGSIPYVMRRTNRYDNEEEFITDFTS